MDDQVLSARPKVLLMDDDASSREAMRLMFEHLDCTVILASNENSALNELIAHRDIDIIVCDIELKKNQKDTIGLIYAGVFKKMRDDIPLASYSARYYGLSPQELRIFDLSYDKSSSSVDDLSNFARDCKALAVSHREIKRVLVTQVPASHRSSVDDRIPTLASKIEVFDKRLGKVEILEEKILQLLNRLEKVEKNYYSKEQIKSFFNRANLIFGLIAGAASIISLVALFK